jgi:hypothetical protein
MLFEMIGLSLAMSACFPVPFLHEPAVPFQQIRGFIFPEGAVHYRRNNQF